MCMPLALCYEIQFLGFLFCIVIILFSFFLWELIYVTVTDCVVSFFALVNGNGGPTVQLKQTELRGVNALPVL